MTRKIEPQKSGGWKVRYREGVNTDGKPKQSSWTFDHKHEAIRFRNLLAEGVAPAEARRLMKVDEASRTGPTLDELAAQFFAWKETRVRSDRTVADYRRDYDNWIKPTLGERRAAGITERDVQSLIDTMATKLAPKSVADRHAILHGIYKWGAASSRRLVDHNPCLDTDLPKRRKAAPKGLRPNEWVALHRALTTIDRDAADLAEFLLATGWRWSEATALDVFDVEDDGRDIHVTVGRVVRRNSRNQFEIVEDTKSAAGMRRVRLDASAAEMVRRRVGARHSGLVFTTKLGSQWHYSNFRKRAWNPAVKAAGLTRDPTPHWLRHTHVGWMLMGGRATLPELQRRIGHENISTTIDVYGRMVDDVSADALESFAAMRASGRALPSPDANAPQGTPPSIPPARSADA